MIHKTKDYNQFIFREDNRAKISQAHVERLAQSIASRNLLEFKPILVKAAMEIIDGQHRFLAAKKLGIEIYYEIKKDINPLDVITLTISKAWMFSAYFNFFCKNNYTEYLKLKDFVDKNKIPHNQMAFDHGDIIIDLINKIKLV